MRVLIVTSIFPPEIGGPATYVPMLATGLHERGHTVKVLTLSEPEHMRHRDTYPYEIVRVSGAGPRPRRALSLLKETARLAGNADVVYGNSTSMLEPALVARARRKPYVLKVVGDGAWEVATRRRWTNLRFEDFQRQRLSPRLEALKRLRTWHAKRAKRVITPSHFLAEVVRDWGVGDERVEVISNAVPPVNGIEPASLPFGAETNLVSVGRLVPWKHVDGVIEALPSLRDPGLVVVGDGPERPRLEALTRELGVNERVYFAGNRSRDETMALMMACDVFVLNSSYEGLPHTVAEAMTLGLAIVTTGAGGTTEVVRDGENGLLVGTDDSRTLVSTLGRLTSDRNLITSISSRAQADARRLFSPQDMVEQTEGLLARVAQAAA